MDSVPQFKTAEYAGTGGDQCHQCGAALGATYYRLGKSAVCAACAEKIKTAGPQDSHAAYSRALLFGIGGAIAGLILYATFAIVTGLVIGYASLAVGWMIAKAMMAGSKGLGGRRYQIAAVLLTYAAVSLAAVPIGLSSAMRHRGAEVPAQTSATDPSSPSAGSDSQGGQASTDSPEPAGTPNRTNMGTLILTLLGAGLASPFLDLQDPFHGLIGLVILAVGMRIAWQMTAGTAAAQVIGPFKNAGAAPPSLG